jgi:hypothetical protein
MHLIGSCYMDPLQSSEDMECYRKIQMNVLRGIYHFRPRDNLSALICIQVNLNCAYDALPNI